MGLLASQPILTGKMSERDPALKTQGSHILRNDIRVMSVFYKHRDTCTSPPQKTLWEVVLENDLLFLPI